MRHIILCFLVFGISLPLSYALDASVTYATFKNEQQPYIEVYLTVIGKTVDYKKLDSLQYQASVEVLYIFKQGNQIVKFDKYALHSPITEQTLDFIDIKRYGLEAGTYTLDVSLTDQTDTTNVQSFSSTINIDFDESRVDQSDIQLLASVKKDDSKHPLVKNGVRMEALPSNFCHKNMETLHFYNEIYHSETYIQDDFVVSYLVEHNGGPNDGQSIYIGHKRCQSMPITPFLGRLDISDLPSGNYRLRLEVRNRDKELLCEKSVLFIRSNPFLNQIADESEDFDINTTFVARLNADELRYSLKGLTPVTPSANVERLNYVIAHGDIDRQRRFLFNYWAARNPTSPQGAYDKYMEVVRAVDTQFKSGLGFGFETDRGYIFLKYGRPDDMIAVEDEPIAPPYEIWSYHQVGKNNQTNVKFIFYNPNNAAGDYRLLHSTARDEISNPQWQVELYRQAPDQLEGNDYLNGTQIKDGLNRRAARLFNDM